MFVTVTSAFLLLPAGKGTAAGARAAAQAKRAQQGGLCQIPEQNQRGPPSSGADSQLPSQTDRNTRTPTAPAAAGVNSAATRDTVGGGAAVGLPGAGRLQQAANTIPKPVTSQNQVRLVLLASQSHMPVGFAWVGDQ